MNKFGLWHEILGWLGVVAILLAYIGVSFAWLSANEPAYLVMNGLGSLGVLIDAYFKRNYQPVVLNIVWFVVAVMALGLLLRG